MSEAAVQGAEEDHARDGYTEGVAELLHGRQDAGGRTGALGSMFESTVAVIGVMQRPCPAPTSSSPGTSMTTEPPVPNTETQLASSRSPTARITAPAAISRRP